MTRNETDNLHNSIAEFIKDNFTYFCVGTGATATSGDQVDLEYPLTVPAAGTDRNRVYESGDQSGNAFLLNFRLFSTEPSGQPVTITELAALQTATDNDDMGFRYVLPTGITKDNSSEWIFRVSGTVTESGS